MNINHGRIMYKVLENKAIPIDSTIAIEYKVPNSNKKITEMSSMHIGGM